MFVYLSYVTYYKQFHVLSQQANSIVSATIEATLDKLPGQSRAIPCLTFSNQVYTIPLPPHIRSSSSDTPGYFFPALFGLLICRASSKL